MKEIVRLYMIIGIVGSGKSTWAKMKAAEKEKAIIVNRDSIRSMIKGEYIYSKELEALVKDISNAALHKAIINGYDVIIDETNITREKREQWIKAANCMKLHNQELNIVYVWCTEMERNIVYRMNDLRGISKEKWEEVIQGMKEKFEAPDPEEGYNELIKFKNLVEVK